MVIGHSLDLLKSIRKWRGVTPFEATDDTLPGQTTSLRGGFRLSDSAYSQSLQQYSPNNVSKMGSNNGIQWDGSQIKTMVPGVYGNGMPPARLGGESG